MVTLGIGLCYKIVISGDLKGSLPIQMEKVFLLPWFFKILVQNIFDMPKYTCNGWKLFF